MRTKEELKEISKNLIKKSNFTHEENEVLMMSAEYAVISNILVELDENVKFLIYEDLKEEFKENG